ncbi:unnamed protein product [Ectocarpus sp. 13 AM-2016]
MEQYHEALATGHSRGLEGRITPLLGRSSCAKLSLSSFGIERISSHLRRKQSRNGASACRDIDERGAKTTLQKRCLLTSRKNTTIQPTLNHPRITTKHSIEKRGPSL